MPRNTPNEFAKSERFHVRATAQQAHLIKSAAARRNVNLTDYILDSTCTRAEMDSADQNLFVLSEKKWEAFLKALDAPPKVPGGLKRLFARGSIAKSR
ncbi:MAG: DUF1778 domain-containing protein [Acidobacteriaceae bacterium]|nr:DUF1778 domain-containing protein [Acidobacteriaceae bacterium]MBV9765629.1 DUF1778 domain-containing protein [Acidobacteriaceae bacterium]